MTTKTKALLEQLKELHTKCQELYDAVDKYERKLPASMQDGLDMPMECMDEAEMGIRCAIKRISEIEGFDKNGWD